MVSFSILAVLCASRLVDFVSAVPAPAAATVAPEAPSSSTTSSTSSSSFWMANINRAGTVAYGNDSSYAVFRNVMDATYGAKGDGVTDDTAAIQAAIDAGSRCGVGCDSSTTTPAIVYFPAGTYLISKPLVQLYYTQFIGDATNLPTIKGAAAFAGIALLDSDPYLDGGVSQYTNQNNFFRQIRNFKIDTTLLPVGSGAGIHWQVAQATSLQNIEFNMRTDGGTENKQQGIFMDNGSGGFMSDLTFNGGKYGAFLGSQQFTMRNMTFNNQLASGIYMNWAWGFTIQGVNINNCPIGIDMSSGGGNVQNVGSVLVLDSTMSNTPIGISTAYSTTDLGTNGTLILDNVDFSNNVPVAISHNSTLTTILAGNTKVAAFTQGNNYASGSASKKAAVQAPLSSPAVKPTSLLTSTGAFFSRSKPQYETIGVAQFLSIKSAGAKGDGVTDDTASIQKALDAATTSQIVYFDHGAYVVTDTIKVPKDIKITGEIWPLIMASGTAFSDQSNPKPVFQVGQVGDVGSVEISDLIFETLGPQPGAIMMEWNVKEATQGSAGMWDVHFRIGGTAGTKLQSDTCARNNGTVHGAVPACEGAFLLLHVTKQSSIYLENNWLWVSDHELDLGDHGQVDIYNGRGLLVETEEGPAWLYGTSVEHSVLYNYQLSGASNVYMGFIQTETPYFQSNPDATVPFTSNATWSDPVFTNKTAAAANASSINKAWGLRVVDSEDIWVYGAGLYSFFDNYNQDCLATESCQQNMVDIKDSTNINIFGLSTKAAVNMVTVDGASAALGSDNPNTFCQTIAFFQENDTKFTGNSTSATPATSAVNACPR